MDEFIVRHKEEKRELTGRRKHWQSGDDNSCRYCCCRWHRQVNEKASMRRQRTYLYVGWLLLYGKNNNRVMGITDGNRLLVRIFLLRSLENICKWHFTCDYVSKSIYHSPFRRILAAWTKTANWVVIYFVSEEDNCMPLSGHAQTKQWWSLVCMRARRKMKRPPQAKRKNKYNVDNHTMLSKYFQITRISFRCCLISESEWCDAHWYRNTMANRWCHQQNIASPSFAKRMNCTRKCSGTSLVVAPRSITDLSGTIIHNCRRKGTPYPSDVHTIDTDFTPITM